MGMGEGRVDNYMLGIRKAMVRHKAKANNLFASISALWRF